MSAPRGLPFSSRAARWILGLAIPSFLLFLLALVFGPEWARVRSQGATSYSRSSVGHHAFVRLLETLGTPVRRSRHRSAEQAGRDGVLLLLEPLPEPPDMAPDAERLAGMPRTARTVLVALPKRRATEHEDVADWSGPTQLRSLADPERILQALGVEDVRVVRTAAPPRAWTTQGIGPPPSVTGPLQLLEGTGVDPWVACEEGTLIGEVHAAGHRVVVLADPDLLSTAGLAHGGNAVLATRVVEHLRRGGPVIVDEVLHGHALPPNLWRTLFDLPLLVLTLHAVLLALLGLAAGVGRRHPAVRPAEPPRGTAALLEQAQGLLVHHADGWTTAEQYAADTLQAVRRAWHAPGGLAPQAASAWLARVQARQQVAESWSAIEEDRRERRGTPVGVARRVHRWREGMLDGTH